jgi:hypothetical protein
MPVAYEFLFIKKPQTIVYYQITQIETTTAFPTSLFSVAVPFSGAGPGFVVRGGGREYERGLWTASPAGPRQSPGRGPRGRSRPGSSGV